MELSCHKSINFQEKTCKTNKQTKNPVQKKFLYFSKTVILAFRDACLLSHKIKRKIGFLLISHQIKKKYTLG